MADENRPLSEAAEAYYRTVLAMGGRVRTEELSAAQLALTEELSRLALLAPDAGPAHDGTPQHDGTPRREGSRDLVAVDPRLARIALTADRYQQAVRQLGAARDLPAVVDRLADAFHGSAPAGATPTPGGSELVTGSAAVARRVAALIEGCAGELLSARHELPPDPGGRIRDRELAAVARPGVASRFLLRTATRFVPTSRSWVGAVLDAGGEVRTEDLLIEPVLIVDRIAAVIPADPAADPTGTETVCVVTDPGTVAFLRGAFDTVWADALPFPADGDTAEAAEVLKAAILQLLAQGLEQAAIGEALGLAPRTLNKYVAQLKDDHGVSSLFQLGAAVARSS